MAAKSPRTLEKAPSKSVASMIREAVERNGYKDVKDCARSIKVPYDLFNKVVGGHIPKDSQLLEYAKRLNIDSRELILAAYREKAPEEMKHYFNSVTLLEEPNKQIKELKDLIDGCTTDQLEELLRVARMIRSAPRDGCRKAMALIALYQNLEGELMEHLDSLVTLALQHADVEGLDEYREAIAAHKSARSGRKGRLRG